MVRDVRMRGFAERADVEEVDAFLCDSAAVLPGERVPLLECVGRVLAEDVVAEVDVPGFARSAMDGYAIRGEESFGASDYDPIAFAVTKSNDQTRVLRFEFPKKDGPTFQYAIRVNESGGAMYMIDPKVINPMTMMPAYFKTEGLYRVAPEYAGKPILSAQEIEDVVAFLLTLK